MRARRAQQIRRPTGPKHSVDQARLLVMANRSVRTWCEQMTQCVTPAHTDLLELLHEQDTARAAGQSVFEDDAPIRPGLERTREWFAEPITECADHMEPLSELQRQAEQGRRLQDEMWERLQGLPYCEDLVSQAPPGSGPYGEFRAVYRTVLVAMRGELPGSRRPTTHAPRTDPSVTARPPEDTMDP